MQKKYNKITNDLIEIELSNKNFDIIVKYNPEETTPEKIRDKIICLTGVEYVN